MNPLKPELSIIIIVKNQGRLNACLESVIKWSCIRHEIIVVPRDSSVKKPGFLAKIFSRVKYLSNEPMSFGAAVNKGVIASQGDMIMVMHDDTMVGPYFDDKLLKGFDEKEKASCIGPITCSANSIQAYNDFKPFKDIMNDEMIMNIQNDLKQSNQILAKISSFCFLTARGIYSHVGPFEDFPEDLCLTEWIIRAMVKFKLVPFIDTGTYVHHFDDPENGQDGSKQILSIVKTYGPKAYSFVENDLYLNLEKK